MKIQVIKAIMGESRVREVISEKGRLQQLIILPFRHVEKHPILMLLKLCCPLRAKALLRPAINRGFTPFVSNYPNGR
jgi:hypothetical protein